MGVGKRAPAPSVGCMPQAPPSSRAPPSHGGTQLTTHPAPWWWPPPRPRPPPWPEPANADAPTTRLPPRTLALLPRAPFSARPTRPAKTDQPLPPTAVALDAQAAAAAAGRWHCPPATRASRRGAPAGAARPSASQWRSLSRERTGRGALLNNPRGSARHTCSGYRSSSRRHSRPHHGRHPPG